jgi:hypothetical protein
MVESSASCTSRTLLPRSIFTHFSGFYFCSRLSEPQGLAGLEGSGKLKRKEASMSSGLEPATFRGYANKNVEYLYSISVMSCEFLRNRRKERLFSLTVPPVNWKVSRKYVTCCVECHCNNLCVLRQIHSKGSIELHETEPSQLVDGLHRTVTTSPRHFLLLPRLVVAFRSMRYQTFCLLAGDALTEPMEHIYTTFLNRHPFPLAFGRDCKYSFNSQ